MNTQQETVLKTIFQHILKKVSPVTIAGSLRADTKDVAKAAEDYIKFYDARCKVTKTIDEILSPVPADQPATPAVPTLVAFNMFMQKGFPQERMRLLRYLVGNMLGIGGLSLVEMQKCFEEGGMKIIRSELVSIIDKFADMCGAVYMHTTASGEATLSFWETEGKFINKPVLNDVEVLLLKHIAMSVKGMNKRSATKELPLVYPITAGLMACCAIQDAADHLVALKLVTIYPDGKMFINPMGFLYLSELEDISIPNA